MLQAQKALPEDYVAAAGDAIQSRLLSLPPYQSAKSIFLYVSTKQEPSTRRVLRHALDAGKRVYVPKCIRPGEMLAARIQDESCLVPGMLGIPEPMHYSETVSAGELDLIVVPCVCASMDGKRLGHGAGYYDRFLAGNGKNALCLCFHRLLRDDIPMDALDVRMPRVLTEEGLFPCESLDCFTEKGAGCQMFLYGGFSFFNHRMEGF